MKILLVDDESDVLEVLKELLLEHMPGVRLVLCGDGQGALAALEVGDIDLVITDMVMPKPNGRDLLKVIKVEWPDIPVIIMSAHGTINQALELIREGARDFLTKPFVTTELIRRVELALEGVSMKSELRVLRKAMAEERGGILYASKSMKALVARARLVAQSPAPVLITGESGTGKELLARVVHTQGPRQSGPYIPVNCAAFTETLLEAELFGHERGAFTGAARRSRGVISEADGGTLFLDEIGETSPTFQVKLLRFLQEGEVRPVGSSTANNVDARIIAATNRDLAKMMKEHAFRRDLYYRLNVIPLHIPPLRERPEDILLLATHFLRRFGQEVGRELSLSPGAAQRILEHRWPGNVRELENRIRRLAVLAPQDRIAAADLDLSPPPTFRRRRTDTLPFAPGLTFQAAKKAAIDRFERTYLIALLRRHGGRPSHAAQEAGLDRKGLWRLLKKHNLDAESFRNSKIEDDAKGSTPQR